MSVAPGAVASPCDSPCDTVRGMSSARATCSLLRTAALVLPALAAAACGVALPTPAADLPTRESAPAQASAPTATPTPTPTGRARLRDASGDG